MLQIRQLKKIVFLALIFCLLPADLSAQTLQTDIGKEIEELKQGQQVIQQKLQAIESLLEKITAPLAKPMPSGPIIKDAAFEIGNNPLKGSADNGLILVEFTDYECPFCGRYVRETFPQIQKEYIDKGLINYAVIDLPLPSLHPKAIKAAESSHCAEEQGKFWEIHELLMSKQESLGDLSSYAEALNIDVKRFDECVSYGKYADMVRGNMALAQKLGIYAVPGFIIGRIDSSNNRLSVTQYTGFCRGSPEWRSLFSMHKGK
jgi:protein-disulfide isomerase